MHTVIPFCCDVTRPLLCCFCPGFVSLYTVIETVIPFVVMWRVPCCVAVVLASFHCIQLYLFAVMWRVPCCVAVVLASFHRALQYCTSIVSWRIGKTENYGTERSVPFHSVPGFSNHRNNSGLLLPTKINLHKNLTHENLHVYGKRCAIQYVGETQNALHVQLVSHRSNINHNRIDITVGKHFSQPDHSIHDPTIMVIKKIHRDDSNHSKRK